jgi:hypothetical protein
MIDADIIAQKLCNSVNCKQNHITKYYQRRLSFRFYLQYTVLQ